MKKSMEWVGSLVVATCILLPQTVLAEEILFSEDFSTKEYGFTNIDETIVATSKLFMFDSGLTFEYPDAVRGVYVTGHSAGGARFNKLVELMDATELNAMVIDIKDDFGNLTYIPNEQSTLKYAIGKPYIKDPRAMLEVMEEKQITQ